MITELLNDLIQAINKNKDYYISEKGLTIKSTDNSLCLLIQYDRQKDLVKEELTKFQEYLEQLEDELFIEICENIGEDGISNIQGYLESQELDTVRLGISEFKKSASRLIKSKIEKLQQYV